MMNGLSFTDLIGQERAKNTLGRILRSGRMAHAYLFRGPDGVGKKRCAQLMAAVVNCSSPDENGACGSCTSCRKCLSGNHPDLVMLSPDNGTIKIDPVRELCRSLSYPPYESKRRVVIIEDIHTMTLAAANSLLKTLEEPPEQNLLILTAEASRALLQTVVSRCQVITFHGLSVDQTIHVLTGLQPELIREEAELLAGLSDGSPGTALILQKKELIERYRQLRNLLDDPQRAGGVNETLIQAEELASLKEDLPLFLGLLRMWVRDGLLGDAGTSGQRDQELWQRRLDFIDQAERQLARNCNRTLACEVLLFNLQSPTPEVSL